MPTPYTPVNQHNATLSMPNNGETANVASIVEALKDAADNAEYVRQRSPGAKTTTLAINLGQPNYNQHANDSAGEHWAIGVAAGYVANAPFSPYQSDVADTGKVGWEITQQLHLAGFVGGTITTITATLDGDAASATPPHAALPATMPVLRLRTVVVATLVTAVAANTTDSSATKEIYDASHNVVLSPNVVIAAGTRYFVELLGEAGTNAEMGLTLCGLTVTVTPA